jgi:hypothetical protein
MTYGFGLRSDNISFKIWFSNWKMVEFSVLLFDSMNDQSPDSKVDTIFWREEKDSWKAWSKDRWQSKIRNDLSTSPSSLGERVMQSHLLPQVKLGRLGNRLTGLAMDMSTLPSKLKPKYMDLVQQCLLLLNMLASEAKDIFSHPMSQRDVVRCYL